VLILCLVMLEALLHLVPRFRPNPLTYPGEHANRSNRHFIADAELGWKMRAHHVFAWDSQEWQSTYRSNGDGFRSEREFVATDALPKIVLVGDSFTFGTFVNYGDTFGAQMEAALPGTLVYNLGMPGYGIDQMWMSVRHVALRLHPSLVVVGFIDEDFSRSLSAYRPLEGFNKPTFIVDYGKLRPRTPYDTPGWLARAFDNYSWTWSAVQGPLRTLAKHVPHGDWWDLNSRLLGEIKHDLDAYGVPCLFVRIPAKDYFRRFPTLREFMARNHMYYLDLADPGSTPPPKDLHFVTDGHINAKGHAYVAQAIVRFIHTELPQLAATNARSSLAEQEKIR
jgi:hypothetical protein